MPAVYTAQDDVKSERSKYSEPDELVFASRNGTPLNERNLPRRLLKPAGEKLGFLGSAGICFATPMQP